ncbi:spore coat protein U domain-containing protein [Variovorax sp. J22P271]|uniref:Csu type fimbrial protein n=1 Tax=Variovorax davisae TaxID=3053515 RepID=UPI0025767311|nr:spore coat protein U domain-containing protein [Variovorax sp. J22P271]MDM0033210.1 spore coat protein U domain-containing protein [Variovorax sp. J22P271]
MKKLLPFAALATVFACAAVAAPNPATATFQVQIKINKACSVVAGTSSNIDFGTQDPSATGLAANSSFSVTCSKKTPYFIGLAPSNASNAGLGSMTAQNVAPVTGNTDSVPYQLRSVSSAGAIWGDTATGTSVGNGVSGTGTGAPVPHPVFATIPGTGANVTPDSYADTVTIHVNY